MMSSRKNFRPEIRNEDQPYGESALFTAADRAEWEYTPGSYRASYGADIGVDEDDVLPIGYTRRPPVNEWQDECVPVVIVPIVAADMRGRTVATWKWRAELFPDSLLSQEFVRQYRGLEGRMSGRTERRVRGSW